DSGWGFNAGFLWSPDERWRVGGFFRQRPEFEIKRKVVTGEAFFQGAEVPPNQLFPFALPDAYGLGLAFRSANGGLTVAFEWDHVEYSAMISGMISGMIASDPESPYASDLRLDDADELHLGAEYVFISTRPAIALRFGMWLEPAHRTTYEGSVPYLRAILPPSNSQIHYATGLGVAFANFQLDLAVDLSERVDAASLSLIYSW
ncbi:MAG: hypothetical protein GY842_23515, partial [bacterium]|nr:hypothetical protein [bacterium]